MSAKKGKGKKKGSAECTFKPGDRVQVKTGDLANELGYVRFVGAVENKTGIFVGVELDEARGKHDGKIKFTRYFKTAENHGYMAPFEKFQYFEANEISLNWNNVVQIIAINWIRSAFCTESKDEMEDKYISDGLEWIIKYSQLLRFQNVYGVGNNEYGELGLSEIKERLKFTKLKVKDIERAYASDGNFFMVRGADKDNHVLSAGICVSICIFVYLYY